MTEVLNPLPKVIEDADGVLVVPVCPCMFTTCTSGKPRVNGYLSCVDCARSMFRIPIERIRAESRGEHWTPPDPRDAEIERMREDVSNLHDIRRAKNAEIERLRRAMRFAAAALSDGEPAKKTLLDALIAPPLG